MGLRQAVPGDGAGRQQEEVIRVLSDRCLRQTQMPVPRQSSEALRFATSPRRGTGICVMVVLLKAPSGTFFMGKKNVGASPCSLKELLAR
jgi:hypothetical protein